MHAKPRLFARREGFGSVIRCAHGCIHLQLGGTTITLNDEQYLQLVAMVSDSAASYEFFRPDSSEDGTESIRHPEGGDHDETVH